MVHFETKIEGKKFLYRLSSDETFSYLLEYFVVGSGGKYTEGEETGWHHGDSTWREKLFDFNLLNAGITEIRLTLGETEYPNVEGDSQFKSPQYLTVKAVAIGLLYAGVISGIPAKATEVTAPHDRFTALDSLKVTDFSRTNFYPSG